MWGLFDAYINISNNGGWISISEMGDIIYIDLSILSILLSIITFIISIIKFFIKKIIINSFYKGLLIFILSSLNFFNSLLILLG